MSKKITVIVSPIAVIAVGFAAAFLFSRWLGAWAWVPVILIYWALAFYISVFLGKADLKALFARPTGIVLWPILALVVGLIPLPIMLLNLKLLQPAGLVALWIAFALINPFFEELFWRGFLLDSLPFKRKWLRVVYSSVLFVALHPFTFGVFSLGNRNWMMLVSLAIMGPVWAAVRYKSNSLWWPVLSHILVDFFNIAVFVFLNLYVPGPPH